MAISQKIIWKYETPLQGEYLARSLFGGITPGLVSPLDIEIDETGAKLSIKSSFQCYIRPDNYYQAENSQGLLVKVEQEISGGDILSYTVLEDNAVALGMRYTWVSDTSQEAVIETLYYDDVTDNLTDYKGVILCCFDTVNKRVYPNMADFTLAYSQTVPALSGVGYRGLLPREFTNATQGNTADKNIQELVKYLQYSEGLVKSAKTVVPVSAVVGTDRVSKTFYISVPEYIKVDACKDSFFPVYQILSYPNTYYVDSDEDVPESLSILYSDLSDSIDKIGLPSDQTALVALKRSSTIFNSQDDLVLDVSGSGVGSSDGTLSFDKKIITEKLLVSDMDDSGNISDLAERGAYLDKDMFYFSSGEHFKDKEGDVTYKNGVPTNLIDCRTVKTLFHCQPFSVSNGILGEVDTGSSCVFSNSYYFGFADPKFIFGDDQDYSLDVDGFDGNLCFGRVIVTEAKNSFCFWYGCNPFSTVNIQYPKETEGILYRSTDTVSFKYYGEGSYREYPPVSGQGSFRTSLIAPISHRSIYRISDKISVTDYLGKTRDFYLQSSVASQVKANGAIAVDPYYKPQIQVDDWRLGYFDLPIYPPNIEGVEYNLAEYKKPKYMFLDCILPFAEVICQTTISSTQRYLRLYTGSPSKEDPRKRLFGDPASDIYSFVAPGDFLQGNVSFVEIVHFGVNYSYGTSTKIVDDIGKSLSLDFSKEAPQDVVFTVGDLVSRDSDVLPDELQTLFDYNYVFECTGSGVGCIVIKTLDSKAFFKPMLFVRNKSLSSITIYYGEDKNVSVTVPSSGDTYCVSIVTPTLYSSDVRMSASPVFSYFSEKSYSISGGASAFTYAVELEKGLYGGFSPSQRIPERYVAFESSDGSSFDSSLPALFEVVPLGGLPYTNDYGILTVYQGYWKNGDVSIKSATCVYTLNLNKLANKNMITNDVVYRSLVSHVPKAFYCDHLSASVPGVYTMPYCFSDDGLSTWSPKIFHCCVPDSGAFNLDYYIYKSSNPLSLGYRLSPVLSQIAVIPVKSFMDSKEISAMMGYLSYTGFIIDKVNYGSTFFGSTSPEEGYFCLVANRKDKIVTNLFKSDTFYVTIETVVVPKVTEEVIKQLGDLPERVTALETEVSSVQTDLTGAFDFQEDKTVHNKLSEFPLGVNTPTLNTDDITATNVTADNITQKFSSIDSNISLLTDRVSDNTSSITAVSGRVTTAEGDIDSLQSTVGNLSGRVTTAEGDISNLETKVISNTTSISSLDSRLDVIEPITNYVKNSFDTSVTGKVKTGKPVNILIETTGITNGLNVVVPTTPRKQASVLTVMNGVCTLREDGVVLATDSINIRKSSGNKARLGIAEGGLPYAEGSAGWTSFGAALGNNAPDLYKHDPALYTLGQARRIVTATQSWT